MTDVSLTAKAYCKIILHAAKYPYCAVNGILLAKTSSKNKLEYVDAIPLFHIAINLTPMAEIALTQIDQIANQSGLTIAGYYTAHENINDSSLEKANHRISEKVAENFPSACIFVVDNKNLSLDLDNVALKVSQYCDGRYKPLDINKLHLNPDITLDICSSLLAKESYNCLVDFDNHLDDISLDWMNEELNKEIEELKGVFNEVNN